jgi:hypothetical protein
MSINLIDRSFNPLYTLCIHPGESQETSREKVRHYRNKIGLDVAIEALRACWRKKKATMDELWAAAKVCRMAEVMRPYMESLTGPWN